MIARAGAPYQCINQNRGERPSDTFPGLARADRGPAVLLSPGAPEKYAAVSDIQMVHMKPRRRSGSIARNWYKASPVRRSDQPAHQREAQPVPPPHALSSGIMEHTKSKTPPRRDQPECRSPPAAVEPAGVDILSPMDVARTHFDTPKPFFVSIDQRPDNGTTHCGLGLSCHSPTQPTGRTMNRTAATSSGIFRCHLGSRLAADALHLEPAEGAGRQTAGAVQTGPEAVVRHLWSAILVVSAAVQATAWRRSTYCSPPTVSIDSGPSGLTDDSPPTFTFRSEAGANFECSIDTGIPRLRGMLGQWNTHPQLTSERTGPTPSGWGHGCRDRGLGGQHTELHTGHGRA